ncbi:MAG: DUF192 domain-containing protein, partial [Candidatus Omnitrophota bacterium]
MKKIIVIVLIIFLNLPIGAYSWQNKVYFKNHCFYVELAKTVDEYRKGLKYIEQLEEDHGLLFVFKKESNYSISMQDVLISLDIIWLDA